ncbi:MAG: sodium:alanine symporter family protein [Ruminococcaceae bacterium]|nr:sodium:alanine symporter family protein [Oscillospiraceae bacterium]
MGLEFLNKYVFGVGIPVLLLLTGIFYCIRLRFFYFLHPIKVIKSLRSKEKEKGVSSAKALTLALAGTLGVGNMVGVASAIALGGFGAIFWMWVSALVAMIVKYAEIVLAMRYRKYDKDGRPHGAAMYYIKACFGGRTGVILAGIFAFFCIFNALTMGSMIQVSASSNAMYSVFDLPQIAIGAVFALIVFVAMLRGRSGILSLTEKLVPFMTAGFVLVSLAVIFTSPRAAAEAVSKIFEDAFSLRSGAAGVGGFLASGALRYGTMRGILSNEAGCGTAPAAHAVSNCDVPAKQGIWGIFEVFVDTILLCTLTAVVIIMGYSSTDPSGDYMIMTVDAYKAGMGNIAGYFIAIAVLLFGLATVLCWAHYGQEGVKYFSSKKWAKNTFIVLYTLSVILGSVMSTDAVWQVADLSIGVMSAINLSALLMMNREVKQETDAYFGISRKR